MAEVPLTCKAATKVHDELPAEPAAAKEAAKKTMDTLCKSGADQETIRNSYS